ncbi:enoyl-CoA hydratase-related protein [Mycobacteroides franklinii]|uniref:enoyl-CoA hydratase-related protein n=1 Tax=Mycobacteroides franklinii TaxID=948102 RepID=UPI0009926A61|nr:enoyl-CoA hydratase-related protein [Mycobacteroides franklinii]
MSPDEPVGAPDVTVDGGIMRITFTRPDRMNALNGPATAGLIQALESVAGRDDVRVVVISGGAPGSAFTAGADVAELAAGTGDLTPLQAAELTMDNAERLVRAVLNCPVPTIAEVTGAAAGIGASVGLACDLIYAADTAFFLLAFANIGLMPDGGSSALVSASIGRVKANAMALLAQPLNAADAFAAGLVNEVLPGDQLRERVDKTARRLAHGSRRAMQLTKEAMNSVSLKLFDEAIARERQGQIELLISPDAQEGFAAFLEGRRPNFS